MSVTLEIIFIGLIAFAEAGDGAVMLLVDDDQHHPLVYQQKGECEADYGWCSRNDGSYSCKPPDRNGNLIWEASNLDLMVSNVDAGILLSRKTRRRNACPTSSDDQDLGWLPGLDAFNWGFAPLRESCRGDMEGCAIRSRFQLGKGSLTVCHFAHASCSTGSCPLKLFRVGSRERALGNALRLELDVKADCPQIPESCPILWGVDRRELQEPPILFARLKPDTNGLIRLFVMNEPCPNWQTTTTSVEHYKSYYDLLTWPWNWMGGRSPQVVGEACQGSPVGECEEALRELTTSFCRTASSAIDSQSCLVVEPHFGSECRDTSIP